MPETYTAHRRQGGPHRPAVVNVEGVAKQLPRGVPGTQYSTPWFRAPLPRAKRSPGEDLEVLDERFAPKWSPCAGVLPDVRQTILVSDKEFRPVFDVVQHLGRHRQRILGFQLHVPTSARPEVVPRLVN